MNYKNIAVILALLHCRILDDFGENAIFMRSEEFLVDSTFLSKDDFMKIEFWFEKDLSTQLKMGKLNFFLFLDDEPYTSDADRAFALKEIIFEIYKQENVYDIFIF
jgi:hypothetical protein